ncbi:MAG: hypothetical protein LBU57_01185 [Dysgonamonadaceae bacterium]|jgi:hypothetical protein|nr:hypothetical protein [Dysgonamonadaceae bacterium]
MIISNNKRLFATLTLFLSSLVLSGNVNALIFQKLNSDDDTISFSVSLEKNETFGSTLSDIPKIMKDGGLSPNSGETIQNIEIHFKKVPKGYLTESHDDGVIHVSREGKERTLTIDTEKLVTPFLSSTNTKEVKKETKVVKIVKEEVKEEKTVKTPFYIRII